MLRIYKCQGFEIAINSSRNMRTYDSNVGKINVYTLPNIVEWLTKHNVPFDEVYIGKPWCGFEGFYVDDRSIRPSEFINMTYEDIAAMLKREKELIHSMI
jgi:capsule biosynthesis phosphatase